jgi:hypothetical protein
MVSEEATWAGDKIAEGVLKDLITGKTHLLDARASTPFLLQIICT